MRRRIFVFGSNLAGIHGSGSARCAFEDHGAVMGTGEGLMGEAYALPTCSLPGRPLPLDMIRGHVDKFVTFARLNHECDFLVTSVGCGYAGHTAEDIAPLFTGAPDNVYLQMKLAQGF